MERLKILTDDNLSREKSRLVIFGGVDLVEELAKNMFFTMKMSNGIGLAAPQVGLLLRIITVDTTGVGGSFMGIMVNPTITERSGEKGLEEGCLSFPGKKVQTKRAESITVTFQDFEGNVKTRKLTGLDAICVQHEIDHLDGITMFERTAK